jgi:hypothetical protein
MENKKNKRVTISLLMRIEAGGDPIRNLEPPTLRVFQVNGTSMQTQYMQVIEQIVRPPFVNDIAIRAVQNGIVLICIFATDTSQHSLHLFLGVCLMALMDGKKAVGYRIRKVHHYFVSLESSEIFSSHDLSLFSNAKVQINSELHASIQTFSAGILHFLGIYLANL